MLWCSHHLLSHNNVAFWATLELTLQHCCCFSLAAMQHSRPFLPQCCSVMWCSRLLCVAIAASLLSSCRGTPSVFIFGITAIFCCDTPSTNCCQLWRCCHCCCSTPLPLLQHSIALGVVILTLHCHCLLSSLVASVSSCNPLWCLKHHLDWLQHHCQLVIAVTPALLLQWPSIVLPLCHHGDIFMLMCLPPDVASHL